MTKVSDVSPGGTKTVHGGKGFIILYLYLLFFK